MISIQFAPPAKMLNLNNRLHWREQRSTEAAWKMAAFVAARNARLRDVGPRIVTVTFPVLARRRRDPHNFVATVKPIVDGLVTAGLWPDDTAEWVAVTDSRFDEGGSSVIVDLKELT